MERTLFEPEHELFRESYQKFLAQQRGTEPREVGRAGTSSIVTSGSRPESRDSWEPRYLRNSAAAVSRISATTRSSPRETTKGGFSGIGFTLHNDVVAPYLLELTNEEQKQRWLPGFGVGVS